MEQAPLLQTTGVPPFGANGLRFDNDETALFVANTGDDTIVKIPIGLLVTNLALNLELFGLAPSVDTAWTQEVTRYTVSMLPARLPSEDRGKHGDDRGGRDDGGDRDERSGRGGKHRR